ncbi:penicillin-binding transpeptidase domain-containing protein [Streptacidiphilus neutrinimicus]|uniref:penicillin-binding transpeptidase domain-containing protein n=1 Tax=Streptacidiphilus neutrinimicus TaxID=105420 RepID=UPI0005AB4774|nr:penicillin-binding transpeptidase domain-containing protein [Streptacidiphilus neutrinimicus]
MSRTGRRAGLFCLVLILLLLANATRLMFFQAPSLNQNSANQRAVIARYSRPRGDILVAGESVTGSKKTGGTLAYQRTYTDGALYAPVTGFSSQTYGNTLLEGVEDRILTGQDSRLSTNPVWDAISRASVPGGNVFTTINPKAQRAAFQGLGSKRGAVAAIEPGTGRILALASTPSYDPNGITGTGPATVADWTRLTTDTTEPMLNRALRQSYPPGSTFKVVTLAAALQYGLYSGIDVPTNSPDPYTPEDTDHPITNESAGDACLNATLAYALQVSCNTVFAKVGVDVSAQNMVRMAEAFGFNQSGQTIPVGVARSNFDPGLTSEAFLALSSIGQYDTAATPLEMAQVAAAVANNGTLMQPRLLDKITRADGTTVQSFGNRPFGRPFSADVAAQIQQAMVGVVDSGTGTNAQIPGVVVGGKTGTAQNGVGNSGTPYAWFISYAKPSATASSPVAVAVVIEDSDAHRADISGGGLAAPIAKDVMQAVLSG